MTIIFALMVRLNNIIILYCTILLYIDMASHLASLTLVPALTTILTNTSDYNYRSM